MALRLSKEKLNAGVVGGLETLKEGAGYVGELPKRLKNNGKIIHTVSGYVQAGLWAAYPGVNSPRRTGLPILERATLPGGQEVLLFTVEESNVPGIEPIERTIGVVAQMPPGMPHPAFTRHTVEATEDAGRALGVVEGKINNLVVGFNKTSSLEGVLSAVLAEEEQQPNSKQLRRWVAGLLKAAQGNKDVAPPPGDREFASRVYRRAGGTNGAELWRLWAASQGINWPGTAQTKVKIVTHWVPDVMFETIRAAADRGWTPILPHWETTCGYMYNNSWHDPCNGGVTATYGDGARLSNCESKLLINPALAGYTLHVTGNSNAFPYRIPEQWTALYLAVMNELAATEAPREDPLLMEGILREAAQHIPTMIVGSEGDVTLYKVKGNLNDHIEGTVTGEYLGMLDYLEQSVPPGGTFHAHEMPMVGELGRELAQLFGWVQDRRVTWAAQMGR